MPRIVIDNFHKGQSSTPYITDGAYAKSANLDVFSQPGIARINYLPTKESSTTVTAKPTCIVADPAVANRLYAADDGGETYVSTDVGDSWAALTANKGKYIVVWKDHLIAVGYSNGAINTYGPLSGTPAWNTAVGSTSIPVVGGASIADFIFVSENDDKVYILHNNTVATIEENAGQNFDDATAATFTFTNDALVLPEGYEGSCLSEQRENLLIGAYLGTAASKLGRATVFIWDRERNEYDYPVTVPEHSVNAMINKGGKVYVSAGRTGKIYIFSESGLTFYAQIPYDYEAVKDMEIKRYAMGWWRDRLIVGTTSVTGAAATARATPVGVYSIKDGRVNCEFLVSNQEDGTNDDLEIGAIYTVTTESLDILLVGYWDDKNTVYAIDRITDNHNRVVSYGAYLESLFYPVEVATRGESFSELAVQLSRPLQTGEGVRISYRTDINGTWTVLKTNGTDFDFATFGAHSSHRYQFGIKDIENLQIKVALTTGATSKNTPYLLKVVTQ